MIRGLYTAASGMVFQQDQINEIAGNLANTNTNGYKRTELIPKEFGDLVVQFSDPTAPNKMGGGVSSGGRATVNNQGSLRRTLNPLNVALEGPGFFQVQDPRNLADVKNTRDGDFQLDEQGYLATHSGERVMGVDNRPLRLGRVGTDALKISPDGTVRDGELPVGRLKVVPQDGASTASFPAGNLAAPAQATGFQLAQGYLENSNVNIISEMVTMIATSKAYTFGQKVITTHDNILNKTISEYGKLQ